MAYQVRLEGVYDKKTALFLKKQGINEYTFDFRPRSFNYIQKHRFEEIMSQLYFSANGYYLHFCNENPSVIERIINDFKNILQRPLSMDGNVFLEFSDNQSAAWYDHFGLPFYWHYNTCENIEGILCAQNLQGIILDFEYCAQQYREQFFISFYKHIQSSRLKDELKLILSIDWNSNIPPVIEEYLDFDLISLPINAKIESSYRQVNYERLSRELRFERL